MIPAPLVIGVSGHRDLSREDLSALTSRVTAIFREIKKKYPSTPLVLLSALAEGADRLVANIALSTEFGARLIVPLPLPLDVYEQDFETQESLDEFRELFAKRTGLVHIRLLDTAANVAVKGPPRDRQYEAMGQFLARESQILLALWNGLDKKLVGGTASVVRFQTRGIPETGERRLQPAELFPVYQVVTPRVSEPHTDGEPLSTRHLYPRWFKSDREAERYFDRVFGNLDRFNQEISRTDSLLLEQAKRSKEDLLGQIAAKRRERDLLGPIEEAALLPAELLTLERFALADAVAIEFHNRTAAVNSLLHWVVFYTFAAFVLFAHIEGRPTIALGAALLLLTGSYVRHRYTIRVGLDARSLDFRAIAEGLRVRFFWQLAGIEESVADNYLGKQRTELDWMRQALRAWDRSDPRDRRLVDLRHMKSVLRYWVLAQRKYFRRSARRDAEKMELFEIWVRTCLWLMVIAGAGVLLKVISDSQWRCSGEKCAGLDWPIIVVDLLLAAGALLHHFTDRMAFIEHAKQYKRMEGVFKKAFKELKDCVRSCSTKGFQDCLHVLGKEALEENGDWVMLHRERPLELPHP